MKFVAKDVNNPGYVIGYYIHPPVKEVQCHNNNDYNYHCNINIHTYIHTYDGDLTSSRCMSNDNEDTDCKLLSDRFK